MKTTAFLVRVATSAFAAWPLAALAEAAQAGDQQSEPSRLFWMWIGVALVIVAALAAIFMTPSRRQRRR